MNQKEENLISSERGAIMVIGLLMALSLIGTLWFLLGMGATIAFRDRMQDAGDAAAFSQAACNARAMNAICVLNLIILVCVALYLVASVILTAVFVGCYALTFSVWGDLGPAELCWKGYWGYPVMPIPFTSASSGSAVGVRNIAAKALNLIEVVSHYLANGIAFIAPDLGSAAGLDVASDYKSTGPDGKFVLGISLAETNWPGSGFNQDNNERIGLPVENEKLTNDCKHLITLLMGEVVGKVAGKSHADIVMGYISSAVDEYYCRGTGIVDDILTPIHRFTLGGGDDGSYWNDPGPIRQWKHDESPSHANEEMSSSDWYQSWSFAMTPENYTDNDAEHKINLAQQKYGPTGGKPRALFYYSEAEYYFDCDDKWSTTDCNDMPSDVHDMDMTAYSLNWRARLVRMHPPSQAAEIFNVIGDILNIFTSIRQFENNNADADQWIQVLTGLGIFDQFASILRAIPASNHH